MFWWHRKWLVVVIKGGVRSWLAYIIIVVVASTFSLKIMVRLLAWRWSCQWWQGGVRWSTDCYLRREIGLSAWLYERERERERCGQRLPTMALPMPKKMMGACRWWLSVCVCFSTLQCVSLSSSCKFSPLFWFCSSFYTNFPPCVVFCKLYSL